jgi:large conductance mechanosensitive channel
MGIFKEFKEFAVKGNMVDMAVGIIIGAAFGTVVKSLVDDILTPIVSGIFKTPDFSNLFILVRKPEVLEGVDFTSLASIREAGGVALGYGLFINALIAFLMVSIALFMVIKGINTLRRKQDGDMEKAPPPSKNIQLLTEIRDLLKRD